MKLLWIGEHSNKEISDKLLKYGYKPMSITIAQDNLLKGIQNEHPIDTISGCRLPPTRHLNKMFFIGDTWEECDSSKHTFVDLLNVKYLELLYKKRKMKKAAFQWAKNNESNKCHIIVYGLHTPYLACVPQIKRIIRDCSVTCIVPDLPELYDFSMSKLKRILKKIDALEMSKYYKYIDKYVLFTEKMADYLELDFTNYIIMEGSINVDDYNKQLERYGKNEHKSNTIILLYTGAVSYGYGLDKLLEAFSLIDKHNYELWIVGSGNAVDMIETASKKDTRVKYLGHINNRSELIGIQKKASLMMNMIPPENKATDFCFPSKIFEYMLSGNPTLTFRLKGIQEEYYEYLEVIIDITPESIANKIIEVGELSERERARIGNKARDFIRENKNNYIQARKILNFIDSNIIKL